MQYANNLQKINAVNIGKSYKPQRFMSEKDKTARERALEYANNVPKPRVSKKQQQSEKAVSEFQRQETGDMNPSEIERDNNYFDIDHGNIGFNEGIDSTGQEANTIQNLARKHEQYQDEI